LKYVYTEEQEKLIKKLYAEGHGAPYIAKELGVKTCTISSYIKRKIGTRTCRQAARKYHCDDSFFKNIDTEEKAYWLGFMYADGYVSTVKYGKRIGLAISKKDKAHLEKFKKALNADNPINEYKCTKSCYNPGTEYVRLVISSTELYEDAVRQGIVEHKTDVLTRPKIKKELYRHFIRGYFDGDGCLAKTNTKTRHAFSVKILGTEALLDFIKEYIEESGIATIRRYYKRREHQTVSSIELGGSKQSMMFLQTLYKDATVFLERKHNRFLALCELLNSRATLKKVA